MWDCLDLTAISNEGRQRHEIVVVIREQLALVVLPRSFVLALLVLAQMRAIKARFDPHNTLNPGLFVDGI